jgi:hypothetical protein
MENATLPRPDSCSVVVIYDDRLTRARALRACDFLVSQIWDRVELDFHWWRSDFLKDPQLAEAAAQDARTADFLIVCSRDPEELSPTLESWIETWIDKRAGSRGALIDLTNLRAMGSELLPRESLLRQVAQRGKFDYLTTAPEGNEPSRAAYSTAGGTRPPDRFGLNE